MNLKKKILIGYGVAFSLMGLVVAWAIINLWSLGKTTDTILRDYYRSILAVENMLDALGRQDSGILLMVMGDTTKVFLSIAKMKPFFLNGWVGRRTVLPRRANWRRSMPSRIIMGNIVVSSRSSPACSIPMRPPNR